MQCSCITSKPVMSLIHIVFGFFEEENIQKNSIFFMYYMKIHQLQTNTHSCHLSETCKLCVFLPFPLNGLLIL